MVNGNLLIVKNIEQNFCLCYHTASSVMQFWSYCCCYIIKGCNATIRMDKQSNCWDILQLYNVWV